MLKRITYTHTTVEAMKRKSLSMLGQKRSATNNETTRTDSSSQPDAKKQKVHQPTTAEPTSPSNEAGLFFDLIGYEVSHLMNSYTSGAFQISQSISIRLKNINYMTPNSVAMATVWSCFRLKIMHEYYDLERYNYNSEDYDSGEENPSDIVTAVTSDEETERKRERYMTRCYGAPKITKKEQRIMQSPLFNDLLDAANRIKNNFYLGDDSADNFAKHTGKAEFVGTIYLALKFASVATVEYLLDFLENTIKSQWLVSILSDTIQYMHGDTNRRCIDKSKHEALVECSKRVRLRLMSRAPPIAPRVLDSSNDSDIDWLSDNSEL